MFWLIDSCQSSVSADQYRLTVSQAQVSTLWVRVIFWRYSLTSCYFSNDRRLKFNFFSGAPRAKRARGAPLVSKSTHPRKFGNHVTDRLSVRTTGIPMFTLTLSSYFGSPGESWFHINVVINWQLSKQGIRWPVSPDRIAGSGIDPSRSSVFLKLSADNLLVFKWSQAHVYFI